MPPHHGRRGASFRPRPVSAEGLLGTSAQDAGGVGRFYPWITPDQAAKLAKIRPRAVLINRTVKASLVDWGLSDVLMAVGPLGGILRDGLRQLMAKSAAFDPERGPSAASGGSDGQEKYNWKAQLSHDNTLDQEFIGVTHSLGSYLLFNTLNPEFAGASDAGPVARRKPPGRRRKRTRCATSLSERRWSISLPTSLRCSRSRILRARRILQRAAMNSRGLAPAPTVPTAPAANFRSLVNRWKDYQTSFQAVLHPSDAASREKVQVVAWSDPSDVITYRVPRIGDVEVVNLYVQNATRWFGLFESPAQGARQLRQKHGCAARDV